MLRPVKVTAHLVAPIALSPDGHLPHLDAICEWIMSYRMRSIHECSRGRHGCNFARRRGEPVDKPGQIPIPIARQVVDGLPVPRCSFGLAEAQTEVVEHYARKFPTDDASLLRPDQQTVLQTTGGPYKGFRLPLRLISTSRVVWFAALRDRPTRLRAILDRVTHLGKKAVYGYGCVSRWVVEPVDADYSWFAEDVLMRALPVSALPDSLVGVRRSYGACCAPYWQRDFWREIGVPV